MSVSPMPRPEAIWTIPPEIIAPATAPRRAPTIPPQKRSGRNTVKCQSAIPTVNQTTAAISTPPRGRSSMPPVLAAATTGTAALTLGARVALGLGARAGCERLGLRLSLISTIAGRPISRGGGVHRGRRWSARLDRLHRRQVGTRRRRRSTRWGGRCGGTLHSGPDLRHDVLLGEGGHITHLLH